MSKITYVKLDGKPKHITLEKLAEILGSTPKEIETDLKERLGVNMWEFGLPFAEGVKCPFGERDLMNDSCYFGSGVHKCEYFKRYIHDGEHKGTIECCCPKQRLPEKGQPIQLSLF